MKMKLIISFLLLATTLIAQDKVTLQNYYEVPNVGSPALSPDGEKLAFVVTSTDPGENKRNSAIYLLDLKTKEKKKLLDNASSPQWSPDGKFIAYRAKVEFKNGIWKIPVTGGEPEFITEVRGSSHFLGHQAKKNFGWSPDGSKIAFVSADLMVAECDVTDPHAPVIIERTLYKGRTEFSDNKITKVHIVDSDGQNMKVLTPEDYNSFSISWSPDGKQVVFISNRTDDPDHNHNNDIFVADVETGKTTQLVASTGTEHEPVWSPDGKFIAYTATVRPLNTKDSPPEFTKIYMVSADGKVKKDFSQLADVRMRNLQWDDNGQLYFRARKEGKSYLYRINEKKNTAEAIAGGDGMAGSYSISGKKIAYTFESPAQPGEIFITDQEGKKKERVTFETDEWKKDKVFSEFEAFWFTSFDGTKVQGFINYPKGISKNSAALLPTVLRIHGGPHGMYGYSFNDLNELLIANGYAVVMINPRGSDGYGQQFSDGTIRAWGGGDYQDLMTGVDQAIEKYPFIDKEKLAVTGGSYGGFMTNWVITQTDRFKAAATIASLSNMISFYGTSLYQLLIETEFGGMPWDNYDLLWHYSPLAHIKNVKTPTLIVHGEVDYDVPIGQAEELFIALKKLGIPTRFIRNQGEGHSYSARSRLTTYTEMLNWFDKYLRQDSN